MTAGHELKAGLHSRYLLALPQIHYLSVVTNTVHEAGP